MISNYTDGASRGNPGPGGFGTVIKKGTRRKEFSGGFRLTTNNRMELLAVIIGLEALLKPNLEVTIYSDSKYVVDAIEKKWVFGWVKKGFKDKKNPDRCLPRSKASSLSQSQRATTAKKKKREGAKGKTVVKNTKPATVRLAKGGLARRKKDIARGCGAILEDRRKMTQYV